MNWDVRKQKWILNKAELKEDQRMTQLRYLVQHAEKTHVECTDYNCRLCETIKTVKQVLQRWEWKCNTPPRE